MSVKWAATAQRDIARLRAFVASFDQSAADRIVHEILSRVQNVGRFPELGVRLEEFEPRDVRRMIVGDYEVRYDVTPTDADVIRLCHVRDDR